MMQRAVTSVLPSATNMLVNQQQQRGMATLKHISMRLKSVKNIQKITQSMKMVSAAKYTRAERELKQARPYGLGSSQFYEKAEIKAPEKTDESKRVFLAISSDRGLCGAIHSGIGRAIRAEMAKDPNIKIICVGDKSRAILARLFPKNVLFVCNEVKCHVEVKICINLTNFICRSDVCHHNSWTHRNWPMKSWHAATSSLRAESTTTDSSLSSRTKFQTCQCSAWRPLRLLRSCQFTIP